MSGFFRLVVAVVVMCASFSFCLALIVVVVGVPDSEYALPEAFLVVPFATMTVSGLFLAVRARATSVRRPPAGWGRSAPVFADEVSSKPVCHVDSLTQYGYRQHTNRSVAGSTPTATKSHPLC